MRLTTIPAEKPFLRALAAHVLAEHGKDPAHLPQVLILLPSRRACRALRDTFLELSPEGALLLPRIEPVGDVEEDDLFTAHVLKGAYADMEAELPPAIPPLAREMMLTRLIAPLTRPHKDAEVKFVQAATLAHELARLFDEVERNELSFDALATLVPEDFTKHWQQTLRFLEIISTAWPKVLRESGREDPVRRRAALIAALAVLWRKYPPAHPIIAAGLNASEPAVTRLLQVIASLPQGMLILPGLETQLSEEAWDALDETHPQFPLKALLEALEATREQVKLLDTTSISTTCESARHGLWENVFAPAELTAKWQHQALSMSESVSGIHRLDCPTQHDEARAIALMLRETAETTDQTAMVVTGDRALARMIAAHAARFGLNIDDSAGRPLADTPAAVFLRLIAEYALHQAAPVPLLSLLKHPFANGGMPQGEVRKHTRTLEQAVLRGVRHAPGIAPLKQSLRSMTSPPEDAFALLDFLEQAGAEFTELFQRKTASFTELLQTHLAFAERLAATDTEPGANTLWRGETGEAAANFMHELRTHAHELGSIRADTYPALFETFLKRQVYRPRFGLHPRLHIFSPLEARFETADRVIIAGFNEGTWPPVTEVGPWMSRPMQRTFGLPVPERAIGFSASDFMRVAYAKELILTRAEKVDGSPTEPSRWLQRLDALLTGISGDTFTWPQLPYAAWAETLSTPETMPAFAPPSATPPVAARPRKLSVTQIETWQRDPYAIYARCILKLNALDPIDQEPDAAAFGTLIHDALEHFVQAYPETLPADALEQLVTIGESVFASMRALPAVQGYWWPRFEATARWFIEEETERRQTLAYVAAERKGIYSFDAPAGPFTLTTRIDRAELDREGGLILADYKTGSIPESRDVKNGIASQLPLEALIVEKGDINPPLPAHFTMQDFEYWKLAGSNNEIKSVSSMRGAELEALMQNAEGGIKQLVTIFDQPQTPYLACPNPEAKPRYNDYDHLERNDEWAV